MVTAGRNIKRDNHHQLAIEWKKSEDEALKSITLSTGNDTNGKVLIEELDNEPMINEDFFQQPIIDDNEVQVTEVRYPLPRWLRRINVVENFNKFPSHFNRINVADFHNACGENNVTPQHTCETLTHVPSWMQRMDVHAVEMKGDLPSYSLPSWMKKIRVDTGSYSVLPKWMTRINVSAFHQSDQKKSVADQYHFNYEIKGSRSWFSSHIFLSTDDQRWIRPGISDTSLMFTNAQNEVSEIPGRIHL